MEMSGNGQAFEDMLEHMYPAGKVALLGILAKDTVIDWDQIIFKGLTVQGIYGRRMYETWYKMTQMLLAGFPLHKVLTHEIPIDDYQQGFDWFKNQREEDHNHGVEKIGRELRQMMPWIKPVEV